MHFRSLLVAASLAVVLLPGCSSDSSSDSGGSGNEASVTLTGRMSQEDTVNTQNNSTSVRTIAAAVNYSDYTLYCVTFTDPPHSGLGSFDATGNFSVTIDDAAGLSIGCFITDASGASVATVTFNTGTGSGLGDGEDASMALSGGTYEINISFDPESGTASADVSAISQVEPSAADVLDPTALAGTWNLACKADDVNCEFGDNGEGVKNIDVYFNIISGTEDVSGNAVHGMGVWPSQAEYQECGSTEQLIFAKNISGFSQTGAATGPDLPFAHFYTDNAGKFQPFNFGGTIVPAAAMAAISGDDLLAWMNSLATSMGNAAYAYPATDFVLRPGDTWMCPGSTNADFFNGINDPFANLEVRQCVINWFQMLEEHGPVDASGNPVSDGQGGTLGPVPCTPRVGSHIWNSDYLRWYDPMDTMAPQFTGASPIPINKPDGPVEIRSRFALMPLKVEGSSGIAFDRWEDTWTEWHEDPMNPGTSISKTCHHGNEMQIAFVPNATDATKGKAFFTVNEWQWCDGDTPANTYKSFEVDMTKKAGP